MPNDTILPDMDVAANRLRADHAVRLYRHVVSNVHLDVLYLAMLLDETGSNDDILLDDDIGAEVDRCHIATHHHLRVHHILPLHADVLKALQNDIFTDFVLLLRKQVELRLVVFGHGLHHLSIFCR